MSRARTTPKKGKSVNYLFYTPKESVTTQKITPNKHGHKIVGQRGNKTLVKYSNDAPEPYAIVTDYNEKEGDWRFGRYFKSESKAKKVLSTDYNYLPIVRKPKKGQ